MCVITTAAIASGLTAIGATSAAATPWVVASTTIAANALAGAAIGAGVSGAMGARGSDLWRSALIGGAGAGVAAGVGMGLGGITTMTSSASGAGAPMVTQVSNTGGLLAEATTGVPTTVMNGETFVLAGEGASAHWVPATATGTLGGEAISAAAGAGAGNAAKNATAPAASAAAEAKSALGASLALQGGGAAFEAYGNYQEGKEEAKALREQAELDDIRAAQAQESAALEKTDLARRQRMTVGRGRTVAAANGVMLESRAEASPSMWEQDAAAELAWEGEKIAYNANLQSWGYSRNAALKRNAATQARRTGNLRSLTSIIKGGAGMATSWYAHDGGSLFG